MLDYYLKNNKSIDEIKFGISDKKYKKTSIIILWKTHL